MFGRKSDQQADLEAFTIYDSKSKSYGDPVFEKNKDVLMRGILNMFNDPQQKQNMYLKNAEDYSIFRIGTYSKVTGQLTASNLEHVANMHDIRALSRASEGPESDARALYPT